MGHACYSQLMEVRDPTCESWVSSSVMLVLGTEVIMVSSQVPLPAELSHRLLKDDLSLFLTCVWGGGYVYVSLGTLGARGVRTHCSQSSRQFRTT